MSQEDAEDVSGGQEASAVGQEEQQGVPLQNQQAAAAAAFNMFANNMNLMDSDSDSSSDDENPMSTLPPYVVQRVEKLKELNEKREAVMEQYLVDRAALEAKYNKLCEPFYQERAEIIQGKKDDETTEEMGNNETKEDTKDEGQGVGTDDDEQVETVDDDDEGEDDGEEEDPTDSNSNNNNNEIKLVGIPQFWVCAMSHMEPLAEMLTEEDVDCLESITDIRCVDDPEGIGFTLEFQFAPNDYFENAVLTKKYDIPNLLLDDEPILKNVEGCNIEWKSGQSLTFREVTKKQRGTGKNAGKIRTVKKKERKESFFHFFEPPKMPSMDDMDEDEADRLEAAFEQDYDVAQAFRSHIIPKAVMWFTGQAMDDEMEQMMGEAADVAGGQNPFPPSAPGERPPECDQQN